MANVLGCHSHDYFMLHKTPYLQARERNFPACFEEVTTLQTARAEGRVTGNSGRPLGTEGSPQLTASKKLKTLALQPQRPEFCQQYMSLE